MKSLPCVYGKRIGMEHDWHLADSHAGYVGNERIARWLCPCGATKDTVVRRVDS